MTIADPNGASRRPVLDLKTLANTGRPLVLPGAHDALSARMIEAAGFSAYGVGGSALAAVQLALPDAGLKPALRPRPCPPVAARPTSLALTKIRTLIRDPYATYAQYILRLKPLNPLRAQPDARDRGIAIHTILQRFVTERPMGETAFDARTRLLTIAAEVFAQETPFPSARALWLARLERAADHFLRQDEKWGGQTLLTEEKGAVAVGDTGFTLTGTPDRIDQRPDGSVVLIDYKTGTPPSKPQQTTLDLQLHLAAAMAERGGFDGQLMRVSAISYIGLGSGEQAVDTELTTVEIDTLWARFVALIRAYQDPNTGYTARRAVFDTRTPGDYDHLARFGEWDMTDRATPIKVGQDDPA